MTKIAGFIRPRTRIFKTVSKWKRQDKNSEMVIKQSSPAWRVPGSFLLPGLVSLKTVASVLQPILRGAFRHLRLPFFFATSGIYLCVCPLDFRQAIDSQVPEETLCFSLLPCHSFVSGSFCAE